MAGIKRVATIWAIKLAIAVMRGIYAMLKLAPTQNKVVFLSRQSDDTPLDFQLIIDQLRIGAPQVKVKVICRTLGHNWLSMAGYIPSVLAQMRQLATSRVAVLDSYSIPVCVLRHKQTLTVIQLWHGLGAFKKFGYAALDAAEGNTGRAGLDPRTLAHLMHQHENYDFVITSSRLGVDPYAQAFNIDASKVLVVSLPRADLLSDADAMAKTGEQIRAAYPQLKGKVNIIFAPTYRRHGDIDQQVDALANAVDYQRCNLIVRVHPLTKLAHHDHRLLGIEGFATWQVLGVCDVLVTDYSAIAYEMYLLGKPVYFFQADEASYETDRGFFTKPSEWPGPRFTNATDLVRAIEAGQYDMSAIERFTDRQIEHRTGNAARLSAIIAQHCNG